MKRLQCELCGSTDLIKQDGVFVCQSCGMKYSVEEAKKMMDSSVVEVTGKVKVDQTDEISNWYLLAEREKDESKKLEYYKKIYQRDAKSWKAWFHIALSERELENYLPGILDSIDNSTKTDNSSFQKNIQYVITIISNDWGYGINKNFCDSLAKERIKYDKYEFARLHRAIGFLIIIADCVDNRFQGVSCDISIEISKIIEQTIRIIVESPRFLFYLHDFTMYKYMIGDNCYVDFYQLSCNINNKLENVEDGYIPIKPLSPEELITYWFEKLNGEFYYTPIKFSYTASKNSKTFDEQLNKKINSRNKEYLKRYKELVDIIKEQQFDLNHPCVTQKEPISRERLKIEVVKMKTDSAITYKVVANITDGENINNGDFISSIEISYSDINVFSKFSEYISKLSPSSWLIVILLIAIVISIIIYSNN